MQIDRPITIALILFVTLLMVFFLVVPQYNMFKELGPQLGEKRAEFDAQHVYYTEIDKISEDLLARQDELVKIDDALPQDPPIGKVIYYLQETAQENGLIVKDLFLSQSSPNNADNKVAKVRDMVFSSDLVGSYTSLENFITALEESSRIFEVTNISFASTTGTSNSFSLQIRTHSY